MSLKKLIPGVRENIPLKDFNTFRIGGKAKYFFVVKKMEDLMKVIKAAQDFNLPFFIIGNGSNLLVSDKGFKGLLIKLQITSYKLKGRKIYAESGVSLGRLVGIASKNNLAGLEWAVGIPGTLGGSIYGNAGAFGQSMAATIKEVEVYNTKNKKIKKFKNKECKFGYRDSIFKKNKNLIILSAEIELRKGYKKAIRDIMKEYLDYRKKNQPLNFPSIGSIFKNPKGFFAGELIEKSGLKGKKIGNVKISEKHTNFIINLGNGRASDIKKLITLIKKRVKKFFGITLEEEIQYLGF